MNNSFSLLYIFMGGSGIFLFIYYFFLVSIYFWVDDDDDDGDRIMQVLLVFALFYFAEIVFVCECTESVRICNFSCSTKQFTISQNSGCNENKEIFNNEIGSASDGLFSKDTFIQYSNASSSIGTKKSFVKETGLLITFRDKISLK